MGELGSGTGSSYPSALDTDTTSEVNSPNAGRTKARAEVANDLNAAVVAIENELGTDPAGSLTNVKTFLQTEHGVNGTHTSLPSLTDPWIDPRAYGATFDGTTDDTSAMQNALNAIGTAGGYVLLPRSGQAYIASNLTIPEGCGLVGQHFSPDASTNYTALGSTIRLAGTATIIMSPNSKLR